MVNHQKMSILRNLRENSQNSNNTFWNIAQLQHRLPERPFSCVNFNKMQEVTQSENTVVKEYAFPTDRDLSKKRN